LANAGPPGPLATAATFSASALCAFAAVTLCIGVAIDRLSGTPLWLDGSAALATIATSCIFFLRLWHLRAQPLTIALLCLLPVQLGVQTIILVGTSHRPFDPGWIAAAISVAVLLIEIPYLAHHRLHNPG
jgi:hypothetical protein